MKKKVLAGILAATMAFSMAACGSTGSSSDSGSSAASGSTAKTEEKGEPYTVTMVLQGSQQQDEERIEEKINEILEPELNAKLDIVVLPWASATQQLQLMLSGDEKIDLLYTSATTAIQYMHSGQIMDMSELIDKYGKNLKNYGYNVIDMGKDVPCEDIVDTAIRENAAIIGLSALMTTTMMRMQDVVELCKEKGCKSKVIIGGACITQSFADEIGADGYSKDAAECVRLVERLLA